MSIKAKKTEFIGIKCTKETVNDLKKIAEIEDRSMSYIVCLAIAEYIDRWKKNNKTS